LPSVEPTHDQREPKPVGDRSETTRLSEGELRALAVRALTGCGVPSDVAEDAGEILLLGDLFGIHTHGVRRILDYETRIAGGGIRPTAPILAEEIAPALGRVDGAGGLGPAVGREALRLATRLAQKAGIAAVFVRGGNHFGAIAPYCWIAAGDGLATIIASNATTTIAPFGGSDARVGNNPIGFGVPRPGAFPFILDMAASVVSRAKIRDALARGEPIPEGWATDAAGRPTTDPAAALAGFLLPVGAHKGYGLSLAVDLLAGLLSGAAFLTHVVTWVGNADRPQDLGHVFIVLDPSRLLPAAEYERRMSDFARIIHEAPPADPAQPVMLPGEREAARMAEHRARGIPLPRHLCDRLEALAGR
jgi:ureidoglycolate dehydrogenase (NAD+)